MSATTGSETRSGIGARLRAGRERMGMTLLQVAEKMHVDAKVLESLEAERFDALGAPVYAKGHLRHYSELINESTSELLDLYAAATKPAAPDLTQIPKANKRSADPRKLVVPSLIALIAFALVGMVWWILQGMQVGPAKPQTVSETLPPELPLADDTPTPDAAVTAAQPLPPLSRPAIEGSSSAANAPPATAARPVPPPSRPAPEGSVSTAKNSSIEPAPRAIPNLNALAPRRGTPPPLSAAEQAAAAATAAKQPDAARARTIDVTLKFASDSWVEIYDANGAKLFSDIGAAASSHKLTGTPPLRVTFGNAPGVTLNVNGKAVRVPATAVQNDTAQFVINRSGRIVGARPQDGG